MLWYAVVKPCRKSVCLSTVKGWSPVPVTCIASQAWQVSSVGLGSGLGSDSTFDNTFDRCFAAPTVDPACRQQTCASGSQCTCYQSRRCLRAAAPACRTPKLYDCPLRLPVACCGLPGNWAAALQPENCQWWPCSQPTAGSGRHPSPPAEFTLVWLRGRQVLKPGLTASRQSCDSHVCIDYCTDCRQPSCRSWAFKRRSSTLALL